MTTVNFYTVNAPEYYWHQGKPHWNLANKLVHSNLWKTVHPFRQKFDYQPGEYTQMPMYFGRQPQNSWLYGNLDYSFNKKHILIQAHDDWYPDRKAKTLGQPEGGFKYPNGKASKYMTL